MLAIMGSKGFGMALGIFYEQYGQKAHNKKKFFGSFVRAQFLGGP